jgi:diguanylate cyclase (GGDEF)-like protein
MIRAETAGAEQALPAGPVSLDAAILDRLMPMHLVLGEGGRVLHKGPTLRRIVADAPMPEGGFFDRFELLMPAGITNIAVLRSHAGSRLKLRMRHDPDIALRGVVVPVAAGAEVLLNLSFGISVIEAARRYNLTNDDFAATDLATEMHYLIEAKSAVLGESRRLNDRLRAARAAAEEQAFTDALTGLANRRALDGVLDQLIESRRRFALMRIDLDYFKAVNDRMGHAAGDHVLQAAAGLLRDCLREGDTVARVGGDEFVILLRDRTDAPGLAAIAGRIIDRLSQPIGFEDAECRISGSIGTTVSTHYPSPAADRMLRDADAALYLSKQNGRSRATLVSPQMLAECALDQVLAGVPR